VLAVAASSITNVPEPVTSKPLVPPLPTSLNTSGSSAELL
jgi:hypothetical protein